MSWTLTHRFLNAAGRPATGWVYFAVSDSPLLTDTATIVSTGDRVKLDRHGSFTVTSLPSEPDGWLTLYPRIVLGDPFGLGPVSVPLQPDGTTIDLDQLLPDGWPRFPTLPAVITRAQWEALLARVAALEAGSADPDPDPEPDPDPDPDPEPDPGMDPSVFTMSLPVTLA